MMKQCFWPHGAILALLLLPTALCASMSRPSREEALELIDQDPRDTSHRILARRLVEGELSETFLPLLGPLHFDPVAVEASEDAFVETGDFIKVYHLCYRHLIEDEQLFSGLNDRLEAEIDMQLAVNCVDPHRMHAQLQIHKISWSYKLKTGTLHSGKIERASPESVPFSFDTKSRSQPISYFIHSHLQRQFFSLPDQEEEERLFMSLGIAEQVSLKLPELLLSSFSKLEGQQRKELDSTGQLESRLPQSGAKWTFAQEPSCDDLFSDTKVRVLYLDQDKLGRVPVPLVVESISLTLLEDP